MHKLVAWVRQVLVPTLGPAGIFVACFLDSSFLSLPEISDLLVVTSAATSALDGWIAVVLATTGSVCGCCSMWWVGKRGGEAFLVRRFGQGAVDRTRKAFQRWDVLALAIPAISPPPIPFKIFVIAAGVFQVPFWRFTITLTVARGLRYVVWAVLGIVYGRRAEELLRSLDAWASGHLPLLLTLLGIAVFTGVLVYLLRRRGRAATASGDSAIMPSGDLKG
jgi:membrane protein YqaA with SNARE-associated domain